MPVTEEELRAYEEAARKRLRARGRILFALQRCSTKETHLKYAELSASDDVEPKMGVLDGDDSLLAWFQEV